MKKKFNFSYPRQDPEDRCCVISRDPEFIPYLDRKVPSYRVTFGPVPGNEIGSAPLFRMPHARHFGNALVALLVAFAHRDLRLRGVAR